MKKIKRNKGFTLMEILATLVILSMLILIATSSIRAISQKTKNKMFCTKVQGIVAAAVLYGQDTGCAIKSPPTCNPDPSCATQAPPTCNKVKVQDLIDNKYLKNDNSTTDIVDPRNKKVSLKTKQITITYENRRVYAAYNYDSADTDLCN